MNKKELIDAVATSSGATKSDVESILDTLVREVADALGRGESVSLPGFGTFEVRHRAARKGRNPQTGAEIDIAATDAPAFKAATALKRHVAG